MDIASFVRDCAMCLWDPIGSQYEHSKNYQTNLDKLKESAATLEARKDDVEIKIKTDESNNKIIKKEAKDWQNRVEKMLNESKSILNETAKKPKNSCWGFPHCCWRLKMSKQAEEKAESINTILREEKILSVSIPLAQAPPPQGLTIPTTIGMEKFQLFSSTEVAMKRVMEALKGNVVRVIGVHGMGGVGKTTMVIKLADQVSEERLFDHVVMATVSQNDRNLKRIQTQIAQGFGLNLGAGTQEWRALKLKKKIMSEKRVLIILDDIWKMLNLESVGIPCNAELENCESKILITTRLENVCHRMKCQEKINLQHLNEPDSWEFFKTTSRTNFDQPEFEEVGRKVAGECKGLPIALVAVAKALGDKDINEWNSALERLERSEPVNGDDDYTVFNCIKLSYDFLGRLEKACFLVCCLFPEDHNIAKEEIARYGMGIGLFQNNIDSIEKARGEADTIAKKLIASGLLLHGDKKEQVKMHDVIRDVAILITSSDPFWLSSSGNDHQHYVFMVEAGSGKRDWPRRESYEKYTSISCMFNEIQRLPDGLDCPKLQALLLQENSTLKEIPDTFFRGMITLRVLDLNGIQASSLPSSIELLKNLRTLYLDRSKFEDVALLGALEKLEILSLKETYIKTLPEELGKLSKLRMLDLTMCCLIKNIPTNLFSSFSYLEELYLKGSFAEWKVEDGSSSSEAGNTSSSTACFGELVDLLCLSIVKVDIADVNCLPLIVKCVPKWVKFDVAICGNPGKRLIYASLSRKTTSTIEYSRALMLDIAMNKLPDWFIEVVSEKAEKLVYSGCSALNLVEELHRGRLTGLKSLDVEQCDEVRHLMRLGEGSQSQLPLFESLEELKIHHMYSMEGICVEELPRGTFARLKFLEVKQCNCLVRSLLPSNLIKRLLNLETLWVSGDSVKEVFGSEGLEVNNNNNAGTLYLGRLREMKLQNLSKLENIWKGPAHLADFSNLKVVTVVKCKELSNLFSVSVLSRGLLQLEDLWVEECLEMVEIISDDPGISVVNRVQLPKMKTLCLKNLPMLIGFCPGIVLECPSLEHLHVLNCQKFTNVVADFHSSKQVQENDEQHMKLLKKRMGEALN
ncbi:probable disease resistance protein At4g27220 [Humulus lupulus]|uniref:probable disease resistance protein At4g27220 n=1 Tax=Humulus lupulus TaxID=3486 RepID=UPI002B400C8C|nr:probable disease resistance protein At4g27220 [Humulus lupulus]